MSHTLRHPRRHTGRCRPHLERLESRLALSASSSSVLIATTIVSPRSASDTTAAAPSQNPYLTPVAPDPAPGSTLTQGPTTVTVTFDRPIDPSSYLTGDVVINQQVNGNWIPFFDPLSLPNESLDPSGTQLSLQLSQPLPPGQYQVVLPEYSQLMGLDGSTVADLGQDQVLGQFSVIQPGVTLADAQDVGSPVSLPITVAGNLDIADNPGAVKLYKFTLPEGHHWRFGAEIDAQRDGSPLRSALALFDGQGHLITTANLGRPGTPHDPYLFAGLAPGTYYIGVSGQVNVPGQPGGYDPVTGLYGPLPDPLAGGPFHLSIVADPFDTPTRAPRSRPA
jgi:CopC domain